MYIDTIVKENLIGMERSTESTTFEAVLDVATPAHVELGKQIVVLVLLRLKSKENLSAFLSMNTTLGIRPGDIKLSKPFQVNLTPNQGLETAHSGSFELVIDSPGFSPKIASKQLTINERIDSMPNLNFLSATTVGTNAITVSLLDKGRIITSCELECHCAPRVSAKSTMHSFKTDQWKAN